MSTDPEIAPPEIDLDVFDSEEALEPQDEEQAPGLKAKLIGLLKSRIGMAAMAAVIVGGGATYMLTSGASDSVRDSESDFADAAIHGSVSSIVKAEQKTSEKTAYEKDSPPAEPSEQADEKEDYQNQYGWISNSTSNSVFHTAPATVSLKNGELTAELTLSVGIVVEKDTAARLLDEGLTVNVLKIEAAQAVDIGPYLDWQLPGIITQDLKRRLEDEYPDIAVHGIMIRDFTLT